ARVWKDICRDNRKTFIYNSTDFQRKAVAMREAFALAQKMVNQFEPSSNNPVWLKESGLSLEELARQLKTTTYESATELNKQHLKIGILLMSIVLCDGVGFDNTVIERYWKKLK